MKKIPRPEINLRLTTGTLLHAGGRTDAHRVYKARFVRAGRVRSAGNGESDIRITPDALQSALSAGMFNARAVFLDHAIGFDYPSLDKIAGVTFDPRWVAAPGGGEVQGSIRLFNTPAGKAAALLLDELLAEPDTAPDVGLSMVFYPEWEAKDNLRYVTAIRHIESIDLVFEPAAEGRILQALSANFTRHTQLKGENLMTIQSEEKKDKADLQLDTVQPVMENHSGDFSHEPSDEQTGAAQSTAGEIEKWNRALAKAAARSIIQNADLPEPARARLLANAGKNVFATPEEVEEAIRAESAYLASLKQEQVIDIGGNPPRGSAVRGMRTSMERIEGAFDALLAGTRPANGVQPLSGIRELYHLLSGDYEMSGVFHPERVRFANVNSSTMAGLVANALNKRIVNEFQSYPRWWEPIVNMEDFASLQQVKWITLGGVGELPTVSEGAAYSELAWDDQTETADFVKKGGYLGLTIEAIDKDDTRRLRAAPRALAQAAWLTLSKAIASIFTTNSGAGPAMSDGNALFDSSHNNLGANSLSISAYAAARTAMRKQTELNSGERLGALTAPHYLLVPPDLEITALQVLASEYDYSYALADAPAAPVNPLTAAGDLQARMNFARSRVIVVDLWTDTNNWAAAANPRLYPVIGLAFRYGRSPEVFSVASPTAGLMFTNDTMPVKVRFFFAAGPMDYRGLYKANVA